MFKLRNISAFSAFILLIALAFTSCREKPLPEKSAEQLYEQTGDLLCADNGFTVGYYGGEWAVIGLARSGRLSNEAAAAYLDSVKSYVEEIGSERLSATKSTDNSRLILAITAAGGDPGDIGGYNLLAGLSDIEYVKRQGNNGPIWALIAFDCLQYEIPAAENPDNQTTREKLLDYILSVQCGDGGWSFTGDASDADITAMALQSLAPYKGRQEVGSAVDKGLSYLSSVQNENGAFDSGGVSDSESCSQVIVALTSLGIDPDSDGRFIKNGTTVVEALCDFASEDGFCHTLESPQADEMATEQAYYALTAYFRFRSGELPLYDMGDNVRLSSETS